MRKMALIIFVSVMMACGVAQAAILDVIESPTGYFAPYQTTSSPYYRWYDEDWGWQHNPIAGTITSAVLDISAWDVDADDSWDPEIDNIYAYDGATKTFLGSLQGLDGGWGYSTFTLGSNFYDDIQGGLKLWIDIDTTHTYDNWAVMLAKSALSVNGETILPGAAPGEEIPEQPGAGVPEPASMILMGMGLAGAAMRRRRK